MTTPSPIPFGKYFTIEYLDGRPMLRAQLRGTFLFCVPIVQARLSIETQVTRSPVPELRTPPEERQLIVKTRHGIVTAALPPELRVELRESSIWPFRKRDICRRVMCTLWFPGEASTAPALFRDSCRAFRTTEETPAQSKAREEREREDFKEQVKKYLANRQPNWFTAVRARDALNYLNEDCPAIWGLEARLERVRRRFGGGHLTRLDIHYLLAEAYQDSIRRRACLAAAWWERFATTAGAATPTQSPEGSAPVPPDNQDT